MTDLGEEAKKEGKIGYMSDTVENPPDPPDPLDELEARFVGLCHQFSVMGEHLKVVAAGIRRLVEERE